MVFHQLANLLLASVLLSSLVPIKQCNGKKFGTTTKAITTERKSRTDENQISCTKWSEPASCYGGKRWETLSNDYLDDISECESLCIEHARSVGDGCCQVYPHLPLGLGCYWKSGAKGVEDTLGGGLASICTNSIPTTIPPPTTCQNTKPEPYCTFVANRYCQASCHRCHITGTTLCRDQKPEHCRTVPRWCPAICDDRCWPASPTVSLAATILPPGTRFVEVCRKDSSCICTENSNRDKKVMLHMGTVTLKQCEMACGKKSSCFGFEYWPHMNDTNCFECTTSPGQTFSIASVSFGKPSSKNQGAVVYQRKN